MVSPLVRQTGKHTATAAETAVDLIPVTMICPPLTGARPHLSDGADTSLSDSAAAGNG